MKVNKNKLLVKDESNILRFKYFKYKMINDYGKLRTRTRGRYILNSAF